MKPEDRQLLEDAVACYQADVAQVGDWLQARGIDGTTAMRARLGYVASPRPGHEPYEGMVALPYITPSGVVDIRFRNLNPEGPKYLTMPGRRARLYNSPAVVFAELDLHICEGEFDALILTHRCGLPAVGIPGAANWRPYYHRVFADFRRLYVWGDGDTAGREFSTKVAKETGATVVHLPDGEDVTSLFMQVGEEGIRERAGLW